MARGQLEHIVRAAAANADTDEIVIVGSQALLGSVPQPTHEVLVRSMEVDVFPLKCPERSILIDGAIGEKSVFHESFGYYAHGVAPETSILPEGWQDRLGSRQHLFPPRHTPRPPPLAEKACCAWHNERSPRRPAPRSNPGSPIFQN